MERVVRRNFIVGSAAAVVALGNGLIDSSQTARAQTKKQPERTPDQWMREWMKRAKDVEGALYMTRFADPVYVLTKPIAWKPNPGQESYAPVNVPIGFVTDFASVPRAFWSLLRPDGEYAYAAVIHDYLYWFQERPKEVADMVFKFAMQDFKIDALTVGAIYKAVEKGGKSAWNENAKLKGKGEKRVLKRFPEDPRIRWAEWKKQPNVF